MTGLVPHVRIGHGRLMTARRNRGSMVPGGRTARRRLVTGRRGVPISPFRRLFLTRVQSKKCLILRATGNAAVAKGAACILC
jgi:hypothetical protein